MAFTAKKGAQTLVLLALLVVFPLLSWLYLQRGLDYRIDALEQLQAKASVPQDLLGIDSGYIYIIHNEALISSSRLQSIKEQFKDRTDVFFTPIDFFSNKMLTDSLDKVMYKVMAEQREPLENILFLVNQGRNFVGAYRIESDQSLGTLTEHIVFLIPPDEERDFEFKREKEK